MPASQSNLIVLQTADPWRYAAMLAVTQRNVVDYCRRHGFAYEAFVGISRGFHAWQASYNRIALMQALIDRGHRGWVLYLDADAYIADLEFDLLSYLQEHQDRGAIIATSGVTGEHWDVNDGVMLINLGHPQGRRLVEQWGARFAALDDDRLRAAEQWIDDDNDQDLLHQLLREDAAIADAVRIESLDLMNSRHARFIRQHLRVHTPDLAERTRRIAAEIDALEPRKPGEAELVQAPDVVPPPAALMEVIIARWRDGPANIAMPDHQREFADLLTRGDITGLRATLAGMGRARVTQGLLGGARQHVRAQDRQFARGLARSTYERLLALAEAVGAPNLPDPDAVFAAVERISGIDLSPPPTVGGYLGIDVGRGRIVHARMIEAIHAAWRLRILRDAHRLAGVVEIGGGIGLIAAYAARFGLDNHWILSPPVLAAVQTAVLGDPASAVSAFPDQRAELLFNTDSLLEMPSDAAIALLQAARARGVKLFLSISTNASEGQMPVRDLVAAAGGWRAAGRHRDWLRPGHVEEIWLAD